MIELEESRAVLVNGRPEVRCTARTTRGARCRRWVQTPNRQCPQHRAAERVRQLTEENRAQL